MIFLYNLIEHHAVLDCVRFEDTEEGQREKDNYAIYAKVVI